MMTVYVDAKIHILFFLIFFGFVKESRVFLKKIDDRVKKTNHQKK